MLFARFVPFIYLDDRNKTGKMVFTKKSAFGENLSKIRFEMKKLLNDNHFQRNLKIFTKCENDI